MKRLLLLLIFCSLTLKGFTFNAGDLFIKNSRFWQNQVSLNIFERDLISSGIIFNLTEHKDRNDQIYAFYIPFVLKLSILDLTINPFWYPDTNNAQAYGGSVKIESLIRKDEINNTYVKGYLQVAFANQKANIVRNLAPVNKENFKQFAFEGGLNLNLANLYNFNLNGNMFTYPDEVKNISYFGGIMNQSDLADLGTIDYVLNFPEFSAGGSITWLSTENSTKTSISYKYINYENNLIAHSVMLKTIIPISEKLITTLIYNHIFATHNTNKDLFGIGFNYLF